MMTSTSTPPFKPFEFRISNESRRRYDLQVLEFKGIEQISQPFSFDVSLVSECANLPLGNLLHSLAYLAFDRNGAGIHGQISRVVRGETGNRLTHYNVTLVPRIDYLRHRINTRIFQHLSVPQIVAQVLEENGIFSSEYQFALDKADYPPRNYCTQYNESDLQLVQRLCAQEGIHFHFRHDEQGPMTVFGDSEVHFKKGLEGRYQQDAGLVEEHPVVNRLDISIRATTHRVVRNDYNFKKPSVRYSADRTITDGTPHPLAEDYQWPANANSEARLKKLAQIAAERNTRDHHVANGASNLSALLSGHFLQLDRHPDDSCNDLWLLTAITHEGRQPQVLEELACHSPTAISPQDRWQGYRNTFSAIPWTTRFRPALEKTPHIHGCESAIVTGPPGEEVHCDEHGRIKVQFFWDRDGQGDNRSSCWLRVGSSWAGDRYGSMVIPRVGMEVLVSFMRGDPDQPYVSGCLPHATNRPPYPLPEHMTRSVFKSASTPGGKGANELRIEDRLGREEIYLHAERDLTQRIKNDHCLEVGGQRHDSVAGNSHTEITAEEHRITHADRKVTLYASDHLQVANSQHTCVGLGQFVEAGEEFHYKAGLKGVIEAGLELTLKAGGHFLTLNPSGIWHNGQLLLGGSPVKGSGAQPLNALPPVTAADTAAVDVPAPALPRSISEDHLLTGAETAGTTCTVCEACRDKALKALSPLA